MQLHYTEVQPYDFDEKKKKTTIVEISSRIHLQ